TPSIPSSAKQKPKMRCLSPLKAVRNHLMKKPSILALLLFGFAAASLQAGGPEVYKQVAPPPLVYGTGFYGAIDLGANVFQNFPDSRTFTDDNPNSPFFGESLEVSPDL